jgi:hypothetical protein
MMQNVFTNFNRVNWLLEQGIELAVMLEKFNVVLNERNL